MLNGEEKLTIYRSLDRVASADDTTALAGLRETQAFLTARKLTLSDFVTAACNVTTPDQARAREIAASPFFNQLDDGTQVFIMQSRTRKGGTQKQLDWFDRIWFQYTAYKNSDKSRHSA